ncbi:MAG: glutamate-5-semialdehyde dehydrogenase [Firmicutes bacterium HGW-Firmicutes-1]|jgi:glutamate-5-semialdehyde dehydrogenase|nr:MAG: glutamate-5-semialdehyde dehydrogenase [Firmicutes bacterium HGW-Firmicutes-1]
MSIQNMASAAKAASIQTAALDGDIKNKALEAIALALEANKEAIMKANSNDLRRSEQENLELPLLKRLKFDEHKIAGVIEGITSLIDLPEPVGQTLMSTELDQGLELYKVSCPIGVIGIIFESRPDALVQIATLCLKSGNAVLLKGGSEAKETNKILADIIEEASIKVGIPTGWIQLLETREDVSEMLKMDDYIDLIIPRGSNAFVKYILQNSNIPVLGHADGICHCYVDDAADLAKAVAIVNDSKTQYVAVCNATETLLVHEAIAGEFLPAVKVELDKSKVIIYGCENTLKIIDCQPASDENYATEYLDYALSVKVVKNVDEAIEHINHYGSGHTDAIITENNVASDKFMTLVDAGNVFLNCSTRFSDGFKYGFGAEVGISTNKIHARGPVGLDGLLIYKYKMIGKGHIAKDYSEGIRSFTHKKIDKPFPIH